jgi:hypothetical protein
MAPRPPTCATCGAPTDNRSGKCNSCLAEGVRAARRAQGLPEEVSPEVYARVLEIMFGPELAEAKRRAAEADGW